MSASWLSKGLRAPCLAAGVVLAACSPAGESGTRGEEVLGPTGGQLLVPDVVEVLVGEGALDAEVPVGATVVEAPVALPASAVSPVVELTPHGTRFAVPARVRLRYTASADAARLRVARLAGPDASSWEPVGGARFSDGVATFDTLVFSFYVVLEDYACELVPTSTACFAGCECCGTAACVDTATSADHCGACGQACASDSFCASNQSCVAASPRSLCANGWLYVVQGALPALDVVNPEQTTDSLYADRLSALLAAACPGLTVRRVHEAEPGLLDPCTDAPLPGGGTTFLVTGGTFAQRLARYLEGSGSPLVQWVSDDESEYAFVTRSGAEVLRFPQATLGDGHDYFVISIEREPSHGAQVLQVYGVGWEGTEAATWYFEHVVLPAVAAGDAGWSHYVLVEWVDDGDGAKDEGDTFTVRAADVP